MTQAPGKPSRYSWYVVAILTAVSICNYADRVAFSVLAPLIKIDLSLSDSEIGFLSFAFAMFYAVSAIPIARWADRGIRRDVVALALAAWSVMTTLSGVVQSFWQLVAARIGVGVGEAGGSAPASALICDYVPFDKRSRALAIFSSGNGMGAIIGMTAAGWLGHTIGWRWTFIVFGLPGIALAVLIKMTLREPVRGGDGAGGGSTQRSLSAVFSTLWASRTYRYLTLFLVSNGFVQGAILHWLPSLYDRTFALDLATIGLTLGLAMGGGFGVGMLAGGYMADKTAKNDVRMGLRVGAVASAFAMITLCGSLLAATPAFSIALVLLTNVCIGAANGPVVSSLYSVAPSHMRSTAGATAFTLATVFGFGLGPWGVGILSDLMVGHAGANSLLHALLFLPLMTPVLLVSLLLAARALPADLDAIRASPRTS